MKELEEKIKIYFKNLSLIEDLDQEKLINLYFEDFRLSNKIDYEEIYQANPNYKFEEINNEESLVNEENKNIHFSHLKVTKPLKLEIYIIKQDSFLFGKYK